MNMSALACVLVILPTPSCQCRTAGKANKQVNVNGHVNMHDEAEEEQSADDSESGGDEKPVRDIKLRPRKHVSFNMDETPSADEASQVCRRTICSDRHA